ncbi:hypothetical protein [Brumimicrobium sp.]|uniref:hypothetical protein n=1 Tax=Brumimicrobium sp. TaxID=2029867 RepID=UPI002628B53A|nr:hypothetical protein [uncultured Brumimicrobium sp.]
MKKLIAFIISLLLTMSISAQNQTTTTKTTKGTNQENIYPPKYRLIPTDIRWNYIKLNTRNGLMWHVKIDIEEDTRFENYLSTLTLIEENKEVNGRFKLYTTDNIYTFILLDQIDGRMWQVSWFEETGSINLVLIK